VRSKAELRIGLRRRIECLKVPFKLFGWHLLFTGPTQMLQGLQRETEEVISQLDKESVKYSVDRVQSYFVGIMAA
jgi:hypothetical protein